MGPGLIRMEEASGGIRLFGELTFDSVPQLVGDSLVMPGDGSIAIDLSGLDKVDSAGLALLLGWVRKYREAGGGLNFQGIPRQLRALIRISELESVFQLSTDDEAKD